MSGMSEAFTAIERISLVQRAECEWFGVFDALRANVHAGEVGCMGNALESFNPLHQGRMTGRSEEPNVYPARHA